MAKAVYVGVDSKARKMKKAYIGINPKDSEPAIYIYDIPTGTLTKGLSIQEGYAFDRIVDLLD